MQIITKSCLLLVSALMLAGLPGGAFATSDPPGLSAVASAADGKGGFDELDGAWGTATVTVGTKTYVLVASYADDGIQIIDITDPARPVATASVTDGVDGFDELDNASDIATVAIGAGTYALVASFTDDGIQIIDITNPARPVAAASATDGVDGFDVLAGARGIDTAKIGARTYALVASFTDDGIQIIDITNPARPAAVASATDGVGEFDELDGAGAVATARIGAKTYALVASFTDDGIQIIDITDPTRPAAVASVTDGEDGFDGLDGVHDITVVTAGLSTYVLVASHWDDGIQVINVTDPASPVTVASATDGEGGFDELDGAHGIATITIDSSTYALVASLHDDGVQMINVTDPSDPSAVASATEGAGGFDRLDGAADITAVTVNSAAYAIVASSTGDGIQVISLAHDGEAPALVSAVVRSPSKVVLTFSEHLGGITRDGFAVTDSGGSSVTVEAATDNNDSTVTLIFDPVPANLPVVINVSADHGITDAAGNPLSPVGLPVIPAAYDDTLEYMFVPPAAVASATDGRDGFDELRGARGIAVATIGAGTYALVASVYDDGVQIIDITDPSSPAATASVADIAGFTRLVGARGITTVTDGALTYALVASYWDSSVQIINVTDPFNPTTVASATDGMGKFDELDGAADIVAVTIGARTYALVASYADDGVQIIDVTDPSSPAATASVTDGKGGFDELAGARGIAAVTIGASTYALVASYADDGVQIIDITNPSSPAAVSSVSDRIGGFDELAGASGITTVTIDSSTYALVASEYDSGVQIIDITNASDPVAVSSVSDDRNGFDELAGARGIAAVAIGSSTYALVASATDGGVQVIDITNPSSPTAVASAIDGEDGFDGLDGASDIATVAIGTKLYALVASEMDSAIQIIDIAHPSPPEFLSATLDEVAGILAITFSKPISSTGVDLAKLFISDVGETDRIALAGAATIASSDPATITVRLTELQRRSAITLDTAQLDIASSAVAGTDDNPIDASPDRTIDITVTDTTIPISPTPASAVDDADAGFTNLGGACGVAIIGIGSGTYSIVTGSTDNGIQIINITDPFAPAAVSSASDEEEGFTELDGACGIATARIGDSAYALVASEDDDGVQIIDITDPSSPAAVAAMTDGEGGFTELDGAAGIATAWIGSDAYAVVSGTVDDGVQIINITDPSGPVAVAALTDGEGGFTELDGAAGIAIAGIGGSMYALVASGNDDGVQIIDITDPSSPAAASSVGDGKDGFMELDGACGVATARIGDFVYALVTSRSGDGVQIINITDPSSPAAASSVGDGKDGFMELDGACGIAIANVGSITYALVASEDDDGVQIIDITNPSGPVAVAALTDGEGGFTELDGAAGIATAWIGSDAYAVVSGTVDDGVQVIALTADTAAPGFSSAALIGVTGVLTITFSEPIDSVSVSNIDLTRLFISDLDQENQIPLEGAIITTIAYTDTINVTLTETQRQSAVSLAIPQLDISSSAVTDPTGNPIDASSDNPIAIMVIVSKTSDMPHHNGGISSARAFADVDPRENNPSDNGPNPGSNDDNDNDNNNAIDCYS